MFKKLALVPAFITATCVGAVAAGANNSRSWVSATGNDSNSCSVTQPCLTFGGALAQTASGGEINCLTPGGFGAVTISMPVTIDCEGASNGGITVSGGAAITIGTTGAVNLIGLDINGENGNTGPGVNIGGGTVTIRNCKIYGFQNSISGLGISFIPGSSSSTLVVDNVLIANNSYGILDEDFAAIANMSVRNSTISNNSMVGVLVQSENGTHAGATIEQSTVAFNGVGLQVSNLAGGSGAVALLGNSTVVNNGTGVEAVDGGTVYSFKNNQIGGNSSDGTPLIAYPGGPLN